MTLLAALAAAGALRLSETRATADYAQNLRREFEAELAAAHQVRALRLDALEEIARQLARKPRLQAALEDDALDLLYLTAQDELRDIIEPAKNLNPNTSPPTPARFSALRARFYRFLDATGAVIRPASSDHVGLLSPADEAALALPGLPSRLQIGYLPTTPATELIAIPISSTQTGQPVATLVLGFSRPDLLGRRSGETTLRALSLQGRLHLAPDSPAFPASLSLTEPHTLPAQITLDDKPHLLFTQALNPGSLYPLAHEICLYPLDQLTARQHLLRRDLLLAGLVLLVGGYFISRFLAARMSAPVETLASVSSENIRGRNRAEAALELTSEELQRSARFSSDASHQLKTPVAILRAGLEEFRALHAHTPKDHEELSTLVHQTYRLSHIVDDLLLLSRMEAGSLRLTLTTLDLAPLIATALDDLTALSETLNLTIETDLSSSCLIRGEQGYTTIILQNLFENARKYNHPGGRIRISTHPAGDEIILRIGNTGPGIPPDAKRHIFERFHRGPASATTPGHGLGLNLARELALLHLGSLRLTRADSDWTEFEVRFLSAS